MVTVQILARPNRCAANGGDESARIKKVFSRVAASFFSRAGEFPVIVYDAVRQAYQGFDVLGVMGLAIVFFKAYSIGAGTYTGIEAVSNGLPILREPRTTTGKRTMLYMALSLAFIAGGLP